MQLKIIINNYRRTLLNSLTKNIGKSYSEPKPGDIKHEDISNILIIRPNHRLGNQLLLTPLVQEITNTFPECKITLFVKGGVAHPVFKDYKEIVKIIKLPRKPWSNIFKYIMCWISIKGKSYDLVINADKDSSSGRLLTQLPKAKIKIFGDNNLNIQHKYKDYNHISKYPIYVLRYHLEYLGINQHNNSQLPVLDIKLNGDEIKKGAKALTQITKNNNKTICLFTNATGDKCFSSSWWDTLYNKLLIRFPEYNIIEMLPIENISKISFKAPNFYSQDIREMAAIISNTNLFISADNGVMHLASAALTPCIGFFSVTNQEVYGPYGNGSIAINTNTENKIEDWITAINNVLSST